LPQRRRWERGLLFETDFNNQKGEPKPAYSDNNYNLISSGKYQDQTSLPPTGTRFSIYNQNTCKNETKQSKKHLNLGCCKGHFPSKNRFS
jgi:hypothetical protein